MRRISLMIGLLLIFIGVAGTIATFKFNLFTESEKGEQSFAAANIANLNLDSDVAQVSIEPGNTDEVTVAWNTGNFRGDWKIHTALNGDTLQIRTDWKQKSFWSFGLRSKPPVLTIRVPKNHEFKEIQTYNKVGSLDIRHVTADEVSARTSVAQLALEDIKTTKLTAVSKVGMIEIARSSGRIDVRNDVGSVEIQASELEDDINVKTSVGEIEVNLDRKPANAMISGTSGIGDVDVFGGNAVYSAGEMKHQVKLRTELGTIEVHAKQ